MSDVFWFIGGLACAGFPLAILYLHTREARDYFERDRNDKDKQLRKLYGVVARCGPVTSEVRSRMDQEGGWVKAYMPNAQAVMDGHALLAGRFDLIGDIPEQP